MSLHVESRGSGADLVLLHGWGLHSGVWKASSRELGERFRIHAVDLPGHGRSRDVAAGSLDEAADAVAACTPPGAVVCGWSLGALVAQRLARREPQRVRALVLVSATPCFVERPGWSSALRAADVAAYERGIGEDLLPTLQRFIRLNAVGGAGVRDAVRFLARTLAERELPEPRSLRASLGWLRDADLRADAPALGTPTLVLHGARDAIVPVGSARWLAGRLPDARLVEWDDAAHVPFVTHREAFTRELERFCG